MNLLTSESIEHNAFLEHAQSQLEANLEQDSVIQLFGKENVESIKSVNALLFVPNVRHGEIIVPNAYKNTNGIPYVALVPHETLRFSESAQALTSHQRRILSSIAVEWWSISTNDAAKEVAAVEKDHISQSLYANQTVFVKDSKGMLNGNTVTSKSVHTFTTTSTSDTSIVLEGRPVVALAMHDNPSIDGTLLHELVHAGQAITQPVTAGAKSEYLQRMSDEEEQAEKVTIAYEQATTRQFSVLA